VLIKRNGVDVACYSDRIKTLYRAAGTPLGLGVAEGDPGVDAFGNLVVFLEWGDGYSAEVNVGGTITTVAISGVPSDPLEPVTVAGITSGTITGITDLAVADGGTGASSAAGARTNLGAEVAGAAAAVGALKVNIAGHSANSVQVADGAGALADTTPAALKVLLDPALSATYAQGQVGGTPMVAVDVANGGGETAVSLGNLGATHTINLTNGNFQRGTLSADCTVTMPAVSGAAKVKAFTLDVVQDAATPRSLTFAGVTGGWPNGIAPTQSPGLGKRDRYVFTSALGAAWDGVQVAQDIR
jgi:hypothetical protein